MIRIITVIILGVLCTYQSQAQDSPFSAGFTFGINNTNIIFRGIDDSQLSRWEPRTTISLGVVGKLKLGNQWALQSGIVLTERGTTFRPLLNIDTRIWAAEIPLHFRYQTDLNSLLSMIPDDVAHLYGIAGLYLGYGLSAAIALEKDWEKIPFGEQYERLDIGIAFGVGLSIDLDEFAGELQFKRTIGLKDIDSDPELLSYITNNNISLIYYIFR